MLEHVPSTEVQPCPFRGTVCSVAAFLSGVERFDRQCADWVVAHRRRGLNALFVVGSHSGQMGIPWSALLVLMQWRARDGDRLQVRKSLTITVGSWAAAHAVKRLDHRRRPCQDGDAAALVPCPKSSSLPSDEAACAFAAATYAATRLPGLRCRSTWGRCSLPAHGCTLGFTTHRMWPPAPCLA